MPVVHVADASPEDPDATVVSWEANQARAAAVVEGGKGHWQTYME